MGSDAKKTPVKADARDERVFTADEVAAQGHIVIDGAVLDVSRFAGVHPGGAELVQREAGRDATAAYRSARHSPRADAIVRRLRVGSCRTRPLDAVFTLGDLAREGRRALTADARLYYDAGAEDGRSVQEAVDAWDGYWLVPRVLVDVSGVDLSQTVLGTRLALPVLSAPTALLKMAHADGETAVARACAAARCGNCLSTTASSSLEDVAAASPDAYRWFQLYVYKDRSVTRRLVERAYKNGYSAICLTVDLPVLGIRTELERNGFAVPKKYKMANVAAELAAKAPKAGGVDMKSPGDRKAYVAKLYDQSLTLSLLEWVASLSPLPVVVKGVLSVESAAAAASVQAVRGIVVSNHGGRQLSGAVPPAFALPRIAAAARGANVDRARRGWAPVEVYVDGGIRKGSDVLKAVALGARAVLVGRPLIYGLAVAGEEGVAKALDILKAELTNCMQLCGARTLEEITPGMVLTRPSARM